MAKVGKGQLENGPLVLATRKGPGLIKSREAGKKGIKGDPVTGIQSG